MKANQGAPGIAGHDRRGLPRVRAGALAEDRHCDQKWNLSGTYHPAPVRRVFIPKPDGMQLLLEIPTVLDRMIQQAVAQVLGPLFEADFSEHSYGYRPDRSAHMAVAEMEAGWKEGRRHAVECDLKSFFGRVNHDRLMHALKEKVRCPRVLGLI